jgi:hypothetical protein
MFRYDFNLETGVLSFDLEANGLLDTASLIHTASWAVGNSQPCIGTAADLAAVLLKAPAIAGHNILAYDLPLLHKLGFIPSYRLKLDILHWATGGQCKVYDTLLISQLTQGSPNKGYQHGLEAWGIRLGIPKLQVSDWHGAGQAVYDARCKQDVVITQALWGYLSCRAASTDLAAVPVQSVLSKAYPLEAQFADIIAKQVANGVNFDIPLAEQTCRDIAVRMTVLEQGVLHLLPNTTPTKGELDKARIPVKRFNPDGKVNGMFSNWLTHRQLTLSTDLTNILDSTGQVVACLASDTHLKLNKQLRLGNDDGIKDWLLTQGWEPEYWNYKKDSNGDFVKVNGAKVPATAKIRQGSAICVSLQGLMAAQPDTVGLVVKAYLAYGVYAHRLASLQGMLKQPRLAIDGKLGADMATCGAATGRVTHRVVCNIPKSLNDFDVEGLAGAKNAMRACFTVPAGYAMLGYDAAALEARVEAHYVYPYDGGIAYGLELLGEKPNDVHTLNAKALGITRDLAKGVKYALGYGASVGKLQSLLRCDADRAQFVYEQYWLKALCVKQFIDNLVKEWYANKRQYITCIDGSRLYLGSKHLLCNYEFQSTGTKLIKLSGILLDNQLYKQGLYKDKLVYKLIDYHDEGQLAIKQGIEGLNDHVGRLAVACIKQAGVYYKLNVPLDGDYLVGANWGATH